LFQAEPVTLVIVPALNEEGRVGEMVSSVKRVVPSCDVLVVDDCSTDNTRDEALQNGAIVISHPVNLGYGVVLESGYRYALKNGYDIVVQMDGDGQHQAEGIHGLLEPIIHDTADVAIGSRFLGESGESPTGFVRRLGQNLFSLIFLAVTSRTITDPTSGFQCLNKAVLEFFTKTHFPSDFPDTNVLIACHYRGFRITEVPVQMLPRFGGKSMHSGLKPIHYVIKMLLSIMIVILEKRRWKKHVA
jgi:glycosyltransferase involved in cell wall biosynthesis